MVSIFENRKIDNNGPFKSDTDIDTLVSGGPIYRYLLGIGIGHPNMYRATLIKTPFIIGSGRPY